MNVEHQKSMEPKVNTRAINKKNNYSFCVMDENNMVKEKYEEDKECEMIVEVQKKMMITK